MKLAPALFTFLALAAVPATAQIVSASASTFATQGGEANNGGVVASSGAQSGSNYQYQYFNQAPQQEADNRNNRYTTVLHQIPNTDSAEDTGDSSQEEGDSSEAKTNLRVVKLDGPVSDDTVHQVSAASGTQGKTIVNYIKSFHDTVHDATDSVVKTVGDVVKDITTSKGSIIDKAKEIVKGIAESKAAIKEKIIKDLSNSQAALKEKIKNVVDKVTDAIRNFKLPQIDISKILAFATGAVHAIGIGISLAAFIGLVLKDQLKSNFKDDGSGNNPLDIIAKNLHLGTLKFGSNDAKAESTEVESDEDPSETETTLLGTSSTDNSKQPADEDASDSIEDDTEEFNVAAQPSNVAPVQTNQQPIVQQQSGEQQTYENRQPQQQQNNQQVYTQANAQAVAGQNFNQYEQNSGQQAFSQARSDGNIANGPHITRIRLNPGEHVKILRQDGPVAETLVYPRENIQNSQSEGQAYSESQAQVNSQGGPIMNTAQVYSQANSQSQGSVNFQPQNQVGSMTWAQGNSQPLGQVHLTRAQAYSQAQGQVNPQAQGFAFSQAQAQAQAG